MAKTSAKKSEKTVEDLSYEEALVELEGVIVDSLEDGQSPLENSMKLFERGQALVVHCGAFAGSAQAQGARNWQRSLTAFEEESAE
ncbi:MAG: exodeoxyribonuclease VII small subunit [Anaerolineales bacterium]